ncbi:hypothetical protein ACLKA6_017429 [Drosophila palustris]
MVKSKSKSKRKVKRKLIISQPAPKTDEGNDLWFDCNVPMRVNIPTAICLGAPWDILSSIPNILQTNINKLKALPAPGSNNKTLAKSGRSLPTPKTSEILENTTRKFCITVYPMGYGPCGPQSTEDGEIEKSPPVEPKLPKKKKKMNLKKKDKSKLTDYTSRKGSKDISISGDMANTKPRDYDCDNKGCHCSPDEWKIKGSRRGSEDKANPKSCQCKVTKNREPSPENTDSRKGNHINVMKKRKPSPELRKSTDNKIPDSRKGSDDTSSPRSCQCNESRKPDDEKDNPKICNCTGENQGLTPPSKGHASSLSQNEKQLDHDQFPTIIHDLKLSSGQEKGFDQNNLPKSDHVEATKNDRKNKRHVKEDNYISNAKDFKICLLRQETDNSPPVLEEYHVAAFTRSLSSHPLQKGGAESKLNCKCKPGDRDMEKLHAISEDNVETIWRDLKRFCRKNNAKYDDMLQKPVVLVPFRPDSEDNGQIMGLCKPDEWKELKFSRTKSSRNRNNQRPDSESNSLPFKNLRASHSNTSELNNQQKVQFHASQSFDDVRESAANHDIVTHLGPRLVRRGSKDLRHQEEFSENAISHDAKEPSSVLLIGREQRTDLRRKETYTQQSESCVEYCNCSTNMTRDLHRQQQMQLLQKLQHANYEFDRRQQQQLEKYRGTQYGKKRREEAELICCYGYSQQQLHQRQQQRQQRQEQQQQIQQQQQQIQQQQQQQYIEQQQQKKNTAAALFST